MHVEVGDSTRRCETSLARCCTVRSRSSICVNFRTKSGLSSNASGLLFLWQQLSQRPRAKNKAFVDMNPIRSVPPSCQLRQGPEDMRHLRRVVPLSSAGSGRSTCCLCFGSAVVPSKKSILSAKRLDLSFRNLLLLETM